MSQRKIFREIMLLCPSFIDLLIGKLPRGIFPYPLPEEELLDYISLQDPKKGSLTRLNFKRNPGAREPLFYPVPLESCSSFFEFHDKCINRLLPVTGLIGVAIKSVEKELGIPWPESFYFLEEKGILVADPGGIMAVKFFDYEELMAIEKRRMAKNR